MRKVKKSNMAKKKTVEKALNLDSIYLIVEITYVRHVTPANSLKREI